MNRPTANIGTNTTSTYEEVEWDFAVSGETGVCIEALSQDVRDSLRVKQTTLVPVEPEFAVSGETGVCIEEISTSVRDILQTPKAAASVTTTIQQNEPEPTVIGHQGRFFFVDILLYHSTQCSTYILESRNIITRPTCEMRLNH